MLKNLWRVKGVGGWRDKDSQPQEVLEQTLKESVMCASLENGCVCVDMSMKEDGSTSQSKNKAYSKKDVKFHLLSMHLWQPV